MTTQGEAMPRTMTLADAHTASGTEFYDWLDRDVEIPVVSKFACQGDVSLLRVTTPPAITAIPASGVVVAQSGNGGHAHTLTGTGSFDRARPNNDLLIGTLTVPADGEVLLTHPEHGAFLIAPGTYRVGSQREFAGEWRAVCD